MTPKLERQKYETPKLRVHGSIEAITQGATQGRRLDAAFDVGTDIDDLTFS